MGIVYYTEVLQKKLPYQRRAICARIQKSVLRRKVAVLLVDAMETWDFFIRFYVRLFYLFGMLPHCQAFPLPADFWAILKPRHVWRKCFNKLWAQPSSAESMGTPSHSRSWGASSMPKEIKEALSLPTGTAARCQVLDMVWFMFRLFASVSSRIPFDVHDERLKTICKGLEDRVGASRRLRSG